MSPSAHVDPYLVITVTGRKEPVANEANICAAGIGNPLVKDWRVVIGFLNADPPAVRHRDNIASNGHIGRASNHNRRSSPCRGKPVTELQDQIPKYLDVVVSRALINRVSAGARDFIADDFNV